MLFLLEKSKTNDILYSKQAEASCFPLKTKEVMMKKAVFQTAVCKIIANNKIKGNARSLLLELAVNGQVRPVEERKQSYSDSTETLIQALQEIGMPECKASRNGNYYNEGYFIVNDAPRGGKLGNILKINFEM